jgi:hypothetical protein
MIFHIYPTALSSLAIAGAVFRRAGVLPVRPLAGRRRPAAGGQRSSHRDGREDAGSLQLGCPTWILRDVEKSLI